jgi:hypothetical protein
MGRVVFLKQKKGNKEKERRGGGRDRDREVLGTDTTQTRIKGEKEEVMD